MVEGIV